MHCERRHSALSSVSYNKIAIYNVLATSMYESHTLYRVSASHFLPRLHAPGYHGSLNIHYLTRPEQNISISSRLDIRLVQLGSYESLWTNTNLLQFISKGKSAFTFTYIYSPKVQHQLQGFNFVVCGLRNIADIRLQNQ